MSIESPAMGRPTYHETKATSIGWIGDIPPHWAVERVKHVARLATGHTPSRANDAYWANCKIPWVSLADVGRLRSLEFDEIHETVENVSEIGVAYSAARLLPTGTVPLAHGIGGFHSPDGQADGNESALLQLGLR